MTYEVNLVSIFVSALVGIACGAFVGWKLQWPKSIAWLIVIAILAGLSPWTMQSGWIVRIQIPKSSVIGVHIGYWLSFFCATVIVAFGVRMMKGKRVVAG
jgi:4-amino-4-deoxy-L-arabinose transferase-like glycosyltransferase